LHGFILGTGAPESADYAIGSGILNVIRGAGPADWARYFDATNDALAAASRRGFAFNMLSLSSDPERSRMDLHYADPATVMRHCLVRFGRHVAVLQDYGLWEFTAIVRHASSQTASPKPVAP